MIDMLVMYDSRNEAETLAEKLGTYAKHSRPRFDNSIWRAFSIVKLPG